MAAISKSLTYEMGGIWGKCKPPSKVMTPERRKLARNSSAQMVINALEREETPGTYEASRNVTGNLYLTEN